MTDHVRGWDEIEAMFPSYAPGTVRKKYGKEMLEKGFVMKSRKGKNRNICEVWSFKTLIMAFIAKKQAEQGQV